MTAERIAGTLIDSSFNLEYVKKKILNRKKNIKNIFLDQSLISGIGNIYASEILFDAKISPLVLGKKLKISLIMKLIKSTRKILKKAIKHGGSSIRDYRSTDGTLGNFQSNFKVYNKDDSNVIAIGGDYILENKESGIGITLITGNICNAFKYAKKNGKF